MLKAVVVAAMLKGSILGDIFLNQGAPRDRAYRVSEIVIHQSIRWDADPLMVAAIISVENPRLDQYATSVAGAQGIMQVMPLWKTSGFRGCGSDLTHDRTNVCYGVRVWRHYVARSDGHSRALLAYNGCVRAPGCSRYAPLVWNRYLLFRHQASFVQNRSWIDNLVWRMSERKWEREHTLMSNPFRPGYTLVQFRAGGERRSARGAPVGVRAASVAAVPQSIRQSDGARETSHNPIFQKE